MKNIYKNLLCICISFIFIFNVSLSPVLATFAEEAVNWYTVEDISYEEYIELKSQMLGIPQQELIAADNLRSTMTAPTLSYVYRRFAQTFSYTPNIDYKADIVGLFELYGENNYYDITRVDVGSALATGSSYATWTQAATQVISFSALQAKIYATGKYTLLGGIGLGLKGFDFSGNTYWISNYHDLSATVTAEMLKNCPSYG